MKVLLPDIGDFKGVEVIEISVSVGDTVAAEDSLVTLESDKASMEVPSPQAGVVKEILVAIGDSISEGDGILMLELAEGAAAEPAAEQSPTPDPVAEPAAVTEDKPAPPPAEADPPAPRPAPVESMKVDEQAFRKAHASPSVRRYARELGVDLGRVQGTGPKSRIRREDVQGFVKGQLSAAPAAGGSAGAGAPSFDLPSIDFSSFGEIEEQPLSRIKKLSGANLQRNAMLIPHVTQFDQADVTELEAFRQSLKGEAEQRGTKLTFMAFLIKAVVYALQEYP